MAVLKDTAILTIRNTMLNHKSCIEVKGRDDRIYTFLADPQSPLGECYDVLQTMLMHIHKIMADNVKKEADSVMDECCGTECEAENG